MKELVFGAGGLVGSRYVELRNNTIPIKSREELDITDKEAVEARLKNLEGPVINFAAFTDVKQAEKQRNNPRGSVWQVNVEGAKNIAEACADNNLFLIHVSTDFVFPGSEENPGPYPEDTDLDYSSDEHRAAKNLTWYGHTKLVGEQKVMGSGAKTVVVRLSYPFRTHYPDKLDFARNIIHLYDQDKLYPMFVDKTMTLTWIDELVGAIKKIVDNQLTGVFHVASTNTTSPYEFAIYLLKKTRGVEGVVEKGNMKEFLSKNGSIPRPRIGGLETTQSEQKLGIRFQTWQESVDQLAIKLKGE